LDILCSEEDVNQPTNLLADLAKFKLGLLKNPIKPNRLGFSENWVFYFGAMRSRICFFVICCVKCRRQMLPVNWKRGNLLFSKSVSHFLLITVM